MIHAKKKNEKKNEQSPFPNMTCSWFCLWNSFFLRSSLRRRGERMKNLNALHIRSFENYESLMVPKNIPNSFLLGSFLFRQMIILSLTSCCVISFHSIPFHFQTTARHIMRTILTHGHPLQRQKLFFATFRVIAFINSFYECFVVQ